MNPGSSQAPTEPGERENREQFRELMAHLQQVFWIKNAVDDAVLYLSPAYETISGRTCQSMYDDIQTFLDGIHPEDRERVAVAMAGQRETGGYEDEYRIVRLDGSIRWIWARSYPVRDKQGQVLRFAGIAEDVTERKSLEQDRARLAAIVEHAEDAMVSMSLDGVVISWNEGAERQYGYTDEEMIGRPISVLFPPDKYLEYQQTMKKVRKGEAIPAYETTRRRKDDTLINISLSISPIEIRDGAVVGASKIAHDLTRVKELEEQFRQAQKMEAVGRLAAGVAHDFNNLLTVISGYGELLLDMVPDGAPARELLLEIRNAVQRAAALTRQLRIFSRKQRFDLRVVELDSLVAGSANMLKRLVGEDVEIVAVLGSAPGRVKSDPGQLEQVVMNLVVNARDAMPRGGRITIETARTVVEQTSVCCAKGVNPGRYILLAVSDTGCGMDERTRARAFEPFFTTKEKDKGTGLGLAMVDGFIRQCGGHVLVHSEPGVGTTFEVYLAEVDDAMGVVPQAPIVEATTRCDETVLLVEDEASVRSLARQILQKGGYTVLEAARSDEAVRLAESHHGVIHLLVSDVAIPGMGGPALAEEILALKPGIKMLFLSGYADAAADRPGILASEIAFLGKPFTPNTLLRTVRNTLDRDAASKEKLSPRPPDPGPEK